MKTRSGQKIKMTSVEELLGVANEEVATEIELEQIQCFQNHPFKVLDDEKMQDLVNSIYENGILTPVLVRPIGNDRYEMISGHRRMHAATLLQMNIIPAIIREMSDEEAVIKMVDSNIQRDELLPSEKAFAYKMKLDAMKRQGKRTDLTSGQNGQKLSGKVSRDLLAEEMGQSSKQIQRYIRLTNLQPKLLDMVDNKRLNFTIAVDISYIDKEIQSWLYDYIDANGTIIPNQVRTLRKEIASGTVMTQFKMVSILNDCIKPKSTAKNVTFSGKKLEKFFPESYTAADVEKIVFELLEEWKNRQEGAMKDVI
ncbi:ParB/RepB/Spo0J family partition protein [uncultured Eubacterium sp.]|mgnify:CR=1 FL=1|uniref:ParB/RepB/Spo0J family partition protein n=1 Tax=uncultured Eubacterium sp. TaxID=165185 RepID=UPI0025987EBF|nr:ParB/RepB/Spo0J family partition protein [uncultured Eubacterium sp.]